MVDAFGRVTRNMVENLQGEFKDFRIEMREGFADLKKTNTGLYNHLSSRVPKDISNKMAWLTGILGTILGGVTIGLVLTIVN